MSPIHIFFFFRCIVVWAAPINGRLFAFSSYLGPIVNLTFNDESVLRVARVLRLGSLRYPGGSTANSWNMTSGRWIDSAHSFYANRTRAFPEGTFTPQRYMAGIGSILHTSPIWNLNLMTDPDPPSQLNILQRMKVPVEYIELGNEKADENIDAYLKTAALVTKRTRKLFPNAKISVIYCFHVDHKICVPKLRAQLQNKLFDAVTIHHYGPPNATITRAITDPLQRSATLAWAHPKLTSFENDVSKNLSPNIPIWFDEFNWGGSWTGSVTWPNELHGGLRGLMWAAYVLSAIDITDTVRAQGRSGFDAMMYYSLFYQEGSPWSYWASCARVPEIANTPKDTYFDGVSQIIAHFNFVALGSGHTDVTPLRELSNTTVPPTTHAPTGPCVLAVQFNGNISHSSIVALNVCPDDIPITAWPSSQNAKTTTYSGFDVGGWVPADQIDSILSPPWTGGPIAAKSFTGMPTSLSGISLNFITMF